jgi:hypothetical protein
LNFGGVMLDLAYEYYLLKYTEAWLSNFNYMKTERHAIVVEAAVQL